MELQNCAVGARGGMSGNGGKKSRLQADTHPLTLSADNFLKKLQKEKRRPVTSEKELDGDGTKGKPIIQVTTKDHVGNHRKEGMIGGKKA